MLRITRLFARPVAVLLLAGALAPLSVQAAPLGRLPHLHPEAGELADARITVLLYNKGYLFQDVKVNNKVYTVMPHQTLSIKAPAGTPVYADSTGPGHRKGQLLFAVSPALENTTLNLR